LQTLSLNDSALPAHPELVEGPKVKIKFQSAGHILDSAYIEIDTQNKKIITESYF